MTIPVGFWMISLVFSVYFMITWACKLKQAHNLADGLANDKRFNLLLIKLAGGIILFSLPVLFIKPNLTFLLYPPQHLNEPGFLIVWLSLLLSIFGISVTSAKKNKINLFQLPVAGLRIAKSFQYLTVRLLFLFGYELFFRGVLLFTILENTPLIWAICINSALYLIIHVFDSKQEITGTIPFGIILCLITYYTRSIWPAFMMHALLAGIYEATLIFYKPTKPSRP